MCRILLKALPAFLMAGVLAFGQTGAVTRNVRATGEGSVSISPDQVKIAVGVVTQASTAQNASTQNAAAVEQVLAALRSVLGASADIKTISYTLTPNYTYTSGQPAQLTGYTATNVVQATTGDLSLIGKAIDAAIQAGANQVQSLSFGLKDDQSARSQALQAAAKAAQAKVAAIAAGLGVRTGAVLAAQEGTTIIPVGNTPVATTAAAATPVVPGTLSITATVTLEVEILN